MAVIRQSQNTDFKNKPQNRIEGSGVGRKMFPWKREYPWLVIAAEQLIIIQAGSADALLEHRQFSREWGITPLWLGKQLEKLFPGISTHISSKWNGKTDWRNNLQNRVYKMYYSGTSDRGLRHDPKTRATMSREHWRNWPSRIEWENRILKIVSKGIVCVQWRSWL